MTNRRRRAVWAFLLVVLMLALSGCGEAFREGFERGYSGQPASPPTTEQQQPQQPQSPYTPEEQQYAEKMINHLSALNETFATLGPMLQEARLFDNEWKIGVAAQLARMQQLNEEFKAITPPESLKDVHAKFAAAMKDIEPVPDLLAKGIDNLDADALLKATEHLANGSQKMQEANKALEEWEQKKEAGSN